VKASLLLLFALLFLSLGGTQTPPIDRGIRQAERAQEQAEKEIPPPAVQRRQLDFAKARKEADELSKIAQTIPADVDQMAKGELPKDVIEKLKQVEKLSKHLRSQLNP